MTERREVYLTVEEVAQRFRTTPSTVYDWLYKGTAPPSLRIGKRRLFPVDDLAAWESEHMEGRNQAA